jgi:hypothetical protein
MKLNAAAVFVVALVFFLVPSVAAVAHDGIDLGPSGKRSQDEGCSQLVQIKYPFLSCADGEIGLSEMGDSWDNSRRMPVMSDWMEGDGYWGPALNTSDG